MRRLAVGRDALVIVKVGSPGLVEIAGLGLSASADPLTPARFPVLARRPGRYPVRLRPAAGGDPLSAGTLAVVAVR